MYRQKPEIKLVSKIKFVAVDNFSRDEYDKAMQGKYPKKEFVLNHSNMPVQISYINGKNEEVFISWIYYRNFGFA